MAMRENLRNLEAVQNTALELQKKQVKILTQKQKEREELKILEYDVKEYLKSEFEKYIFKIGSTYTVNFYLIERKNQILQNLLNEYTQNNGYVYKKFDIIDFFDKHYYKILKNVEKQKQLDEQAQYWNYVENNPIEIKENKQINYMIILKTIAFIIFLPFVFLGMLVWGVCKNSK